MISSVARRYKFEASHHVPGLPAPWCEPHEHTYTVEVVFEGEIDSELPKESDPWAVVVIDTDQVDAAFEVLRPALEGQDLNESLTVPTTVEALSAWLLEHFGATEVTVWEDDARWGRARAE